VDVNEGMLDFAGAAAADVPGTIRWHRSDAARPVDIAGGAATPPAGSIRQEIVTPWRVTGWWTV
jgi:hypothetical protein